MSELEILQQLERDTLLLATVGDVETMRHTSHAFTVKAAQRLRRQGYGLVRAPAGGNQINGVRIDKLINRVSLEIFDIIVNADDPEGPPRKVAWQFQGKGDARDVVDPPVETEPGSGGGTGGGGGAGGAEPFDEDEFWKALDRIEDGLSNVAGTITLLAERLAQLQRDGIRVRLG